MPLVLGALASSGVASKPHTPPADWAEPRLYHTPFEPGYGERIRIERVAWQQIDVRSISPNRAYRLAVEPVDRCDLESDGTLGCHSRDSNVNLLIDVERDYLLAVRLVDHYPNFQVATRWVNEKLLWMRVWWGRILGSDAVVDVESGEFVYREMVHDGVLDFQQHRQAE